MSKKQIGETMSQDNKNMFRMIMQDIQTDLDIHAIQLDNARKNNDLKQQKKIKSVIDSKNKLYELAQSKFNGETNEI